MLRNWWCKTKPSEWLAVRIPCRPAPRSWLPQLESLESRVVPSFMPGPTYAIGHSPTLSAVGDFNNDGDMDDVAVVNRDDGTVSVLLGQGDGTFQQPRTYQVEGRGSLPRAVAVGDFNGDGYPDLAVADGQTDNVVILLNNGDGTFLTSRAFYAGGPNPFDIAVGDFDGDGNLDLVVANIGPTVQGTFIGNNIAVLRGRGDGTFEPARVFRVGQGPAGLAVADFNNDNQPDIAVSNYTSDTVGVLLNTSSGPGDIEFAPMASYPVPRGDGPNGIGAADFNGDGNMDLVVADTKGNPSAISLFQGTGDGTMQSLGTFPESHLGGPISLAIADFNQDGHPDFAVPRQGNNPANFGVYLGNGDGKFVTPPRDFATGASPVGLVSADLNGDGFPDLIVDGGGSNGYVTVYLNDQDWSSSPQPDTPISRSAGAAGIVDPSLAVAVQAIAPASATSSTPFDATLIGVDHYGNPAIVPPVLGSAIRAGGRVEAVGVNQGPLARREEGRAVAVLRAGPLDLGLGSDLVPQRTDSLRISPAGAVDSLFAKGDLDWTLLRPLNDLAD